LTDAIVGMREDEAKSENMMALRDAPDEYGVF